MKSFKQFIEENQRQNSEDFRSTVNDSTVIFEATPTSYTSTNAGTDLNDSERIVYVSVTFKYPIFGSVKSGEMRRINYDIETVFDVDTSGIVQYNVDYQQDEAEIWGGREVRIPNSFLNTVENIVRSHVKDIEEAIITNETFRVEERFNGRSSSNQ